MWAGHNTLVHPSVCTSSVLGVLIICAMRQCSDHCRAWLCMIKRCAVHSACVCRSPLLNLANVDCRYLVETPANICTPTYLAKVAAVIAESAPDVFKLEIIEEDACEEMGMGCFLGVTACSEEPAKFIHLTYTPKGVLLLTPDIFVVFAMVLGRMEWEMVFSS